MTSFVRPQFQAWAADPMGGFGNNLTVVDKVPPHMMHLIDPYWYQFPPMNPLWHLILGFTISMLGVYDLQISSGFAEESNDPNLAIILFIFK